MGAKLAIFFANPFMGYLEENVFILFAYNHGKDSYIIHSSSEHGKDEMLTILEFALETLFELLNFLDSKIVKI